MFSQRDKSEESHENLCIYYESRRVLMRQQAVAATSGIHLARRMYESQPVHPFGSPSQKIGKQDYSLALMGFCSFLAISLRSFLRILPLGDLGIASMNTTPPRSCL